MSEQECDAYVRAALLAQGYRFSEARILELVRQFERIERIAATILEVDLPLTLESASVFRP
jgi:hypothetical protein